MLGRSFSFAVLAAAALTDEETLLDSLDELEERRILREQGGEGYDFSHDRLRDVMYAELSSARRRQLHRRVAEAIETVYAGRLDEVSGVLADHYEQTGSREKAIHYLQRAGEWAVRQFAYPSAIKYFTHTLKLIPDGNHVARFPLLLARVQLYAHQGLRVEGKRDLEALQAMVGGFAGGRRTAADVLGCPPARRGFDSSTITYRNSSVILPSL